MKNFAHNVSKSNLEGRIVGGKTVKIEEYPYQASILYGGAPLCGGIIIAQRIILTAAHCLYGRRSGQLKVQVGDSHISKGDRHTVWRIEIHDKYDKNSNDYDIGLIFVSRYLPPSSVVDVLVYCNKLPLLQSELIRR